MDRINIGIVGTGIMGQRMMAALAPHPRFEVKTPRDPQSEPLAEAGAAAPVARVAASLDDLVADRRASGGLHRLSSRAAPGRREQRAARRQGLAV